MRRRCTLAGLSVLVDLFGWIDIGMFGFMILASSSGCARGSETDDPRSSLSFHALDLPSAPGSGEPNLTTGPDGVVYICWIESGDEGREAP